MVVERVRSTLPELLIVCYTGQSFSDFDGDLCTAATPSSSKEATRFYAHTPFAPVTTGSRSHYYCQPDVRLLSNGWRSATGNDDSAGRRCYNDRQRTSDNRGSTADGYH